MNMVWVSMSVWSWFVPFFAKVVDWIFQFSQFQQDCFLLKQTSLERFFSSKNAQLKRQIHSVPNNVLSLNHFLSFGNTCPILFLRALFFRSSESFRGRGFWWLPWSAHQIQPHEGSQWLIMGPLTWEMPFTAQKTASDEMFCTLRKLQK